MKYEDFATHFLFGIPIGTVQARLRARRNGVELPGSPLSAINPGGILVKANALTRRNILDDSLNFLLPASWLSGTVELEIQQLASNIGCREAAGPTANDCKTTVNFTSVPTLQVKFVQIRYQDGSEIKSSDSDLVELQNRLLAIYPVSSIDRTTGYLDDGDGIPDAMYLISRLAAMRVLDKCVVDCDRIYYGAVDQAGKLRTVGESAGGLANGIPGTVSCGVIEDDDAYGRNRHAHEIAHCMGSHHAVGANLRGVCGEGARIDAPTFPFVETVGGRKKATIGPLSQGVDKIVFGWDSYRNKVIDPTQQFELLSYCGPSRWISTFTYSSVRSYLITNFRRQRKLRQLMASRNLQTSYTVIRALVNMDNSTTNFLPAFRVDLPTIPTVSSNGYEVLGRNSSGGEVFRLPFHPILFNQDLAVPGDSSIPTNNMYVQAFLPTPSSAVMISSLQVAKNRSVIGSSQSVSANAPTVTVRFPNGGEILSGTNITLLWDATDRDGDELSYFVLFSPDNGITWKTLTTDHRSSRSLMVPLSALGQTSLGLIRVQVSDGFRVSEDVSDATFRTPNIPPLVQVVSPTASNIFEGAQILVLQAVSSDVEDGALADMNFTWTSNLDGFVGIGARVEVSAAGLSEGLHRLTVTGTDSGGATGVATTVVTIYRVAPIPNITQTDAPVPSNPTNAPVPRPTNATPTSSPVAPKCRIFNIFCLWKGFFQWLIGLFR